ncbi:MAG: sensor histidine kinase [Saprospiraceae bacterium]|nr:sensor histidine kinase [Saprospiraceae bacterium]
MDSTNELGLPVFLILCGILAMLLLAMAVISFFMVYQRRLFKQQDDVQKLETDYQRSLVELAFETQEIERKRIASDLHDAVGSVLSATKIYLHQLDPSLSPEYFKELKNDSTDLIDNAIDQIRTISHNMYPPNLEHLGLIQATADLFHRIQKMDGLEADFIYNVAPELSKSQELTLFRIFQELTNNTLKHAKASCIKLHLHKGSDGLKIKYQDDGIGIDPNKLNQKASDGFGMKSIKSRVESINGSVQFSSSNGKGIEFDFFLTLDGDKKVS